jgi:hypothetical protein
MADLTLATADTVNVDTLTVQQHTVLAGEAITAGAPVFLNTTTGYAWLADANDSNTTKPYGIATKTVAAGEAVTVVRRGRLSGWSNLPGYGAAVYVSNTVGTLADAAGSSSWQVGIVEPVFNTPLGTSPDKMLLVECN